MWWVALEGLRRRLRRTVLAVAATALIVALFVIVQSVADSFFVSFFSHFYTTPVDVWVSPETSFPGVGGSPIRPDALSVVGRVDGVASAEENLAVTGKVRWQGEVAEITIVGYEPRGVYSRIPLLEGRRPSEERGATEAILDESARARWPGLAVGDIVRVEDARIEIVGFTRGHKMIASAVMLMPAYNLGAALGRPEGEASLVLARLAPGADPITVSAGIERALGEDVRVLTSQENIEEWKRQLSYIGMVLSGVSAGAFVIGALLMTLVVYISVVERTRELGIMKALGATDVSLRTLVLTEALAVAVPGYVAGIVIGLVAAAVIPRLMPLTPEVTPALLLMSAAVTLVMAFLGSLIGMQRAVGVDPMIAVRTV